MTTLVALQTSFLPWAGYFDLINKSQKFIFYDHVQYDKNGWRNRNKILIQKRTKWLTIPVVNENLEKKLYETKIFKPEVYLKKILKTIQNNYSLHPNFKNFFNLLEKVFLSKKWIFLSDLNIELILMICRYLNIPINYEKSSNLMNDLDKNQNLINLCSKYKCKIYLSGPAAMGYLDKDLFKKNNIEIQWHDYKQNIYSHFGVDKNIFFEKLSIIDYIFNLNERKKS
jgi:hypothetical protein